MDFQIVRQIKKSKHANEVEGDPINFLIQLPSEIVTDVLSRLPITSLIQSTFVCRSLKPLSHDRNLVNMHLSRSSTNGSSCLILHSDFPIRNHLHFLLFSDEKVRKIDIPAAMCMSEFKILGSSNGLLCLMNTLFTESMCLYNPFTRDYFALPNNFEAEDQVVVYGFGSHPVTNDYKVIKIVYYTAAFFRRLARYIPEFDQYFGRRFESEVKIYSLSSNMWKNGGLIPHRLETWSSPGILSNGRLHWMNIFPFNGMQDPMKRTIVSCDLADDSFHVMDSPRFDPSPYSTGVCYLATLEGRLCAYMPTNREAVDIWVMKEYGVSESWEKEYSIRPYIPVSVTSPESSRVTKIRRNWRSTLTRAIVRVLCVLESGEVLLEYRKRGLVCYDPYKQTFKELTFRWASSKFFHPTVHVGSMKSASLP